MKPQDPGQNGRPAEETRSGRSTPAWVPPQDHLDGCCLRGRVGGRCSHSQLWSHSHVRRPQTSRPNGNPFGGSVIALLDASKLGRLNDAHAKGPPALPPPTIGMLRNQGVTLFYVSCTASNCLHGANVQLDALDLPYDMPFPEVRYRRRWICAKCGGRKVSVMPRWPVG